MGISCSGSMLASNPLRIRRGKRESFQKLLTGKIDFGYSIKSVGTSTHLTLPDFAGIPRASWVTRPCSQRHRRVVRIMTEGAGLKFFHSVHRMQEFACESDRVIEDGIPCHPHPSAHSMAFSLLQPRLPTDFVPHRAC